MFEKCVVDVNYGKIKLIKLIIGNHKQKSISEQHSALRLSLFSNMPPYIRFSSHDVKGNFIFMFK
jgi:tubulin polyglutamylase TTLL4